MRAMEAARRSRRPCLLLEDGFIRSIGLGPDDSALGIVVDDLGIYYDASTPSRLEALVLEARERDATARALSLIDAWQRCRVSKYNAARELPPPVAGDYVLVIDQTAADSSISYGQADAGSFARMLEAALDEHPARPILLKVHPDVIAGRKRGHFEGLTDAQAARVTVIADPAHPPSLIERATDVYVVTSQMGFEALLWSKPVRCFGMPFYAGWGLTQDEQAGPRRRSRASLAHLAQAALVDYARYIDPETLERCEPERIVEWMGMQRRHRERFPPRVEVRGFKGWKRPIARVFFAGSELDFVEDAPTVAPDATVALWGVSPAPTDPAPSRVIRVEDGFLRSVGLGADLIDPVSWITDGRGMYFDARSPSDLEHLLSNERFDPQMLERARALRLRIVSLGLTKYNIGRGSWQRPAQAARVVLVPGQVEDDASIACGAIGAVTTNLGLLRAARAAAPDAHLIYKPHPDVVAGLRTRGRDEGDAHAVCDEVVTDTPIHLLMGMVDELHTMTSLAGFEALLRGVKVVCHGCPFYAGWGLTEDRLQVTRRTRMLTLDELVAGTLILYPTYVSRTSGRFTTPERAIDELLAWKTAGGAGRLQWRRWLRLLVGRWRGWRST